MQQPGSFRLVVRRGPQPNQTYEISKDLTTLGRDISNDIVINDRETSRHHLRLARAASGISVEDLGSTNGTFVNGKRVSGVTPLQNGDMIGLGETVTLAVEISMIAPSQTSAGDSPTPAPAMPSQSAPEAPYSPPPAYAPPPAPDPYAQIPEAAAAPAYAEQPQPMQQPAYFNQLGGQGAPPPPGVYPGYDYDPYAGRDEGGGASPWLILGCFVFFLLSFVCLGAIGLLLIDTFNLWCETPVITQIVTALGYCL